MKYRARKHSLKLKKRREVSANTAGLNLPKKWGTIKMGSKYVPFDEYSQPEFGGAKKGCADCLCTHRSYSRLFWLMGICIVVLVILEVL